MRSVAEKISIFQGLSVVIILIVAILSITVIVKNSIINDVEEQFKNRVSDIKSTFEVLGESITQSAITSSNVLSSKINKIELDKEDFITVNGVKTNVLKTNGQIINNNNELIDEFTSITGAVATVFVRQGEDFFRIATSLQKSDGTRAIGTYLTDKSPAYKKVLNKEKYIGTAKLFGKNYMTVYEPIIKDGEVVAILFIGYNFDSIYSILEKNLSKIKFGDTGYLSAINTKDALFTIDPEFKDKKIEELSENNKTVYNEIIGKNNGVGVYSLENNGEVVEKLMAFTTLPEWNIVITANANIDEVLKLYSSLRNYLIFGGLFLVVILIVASEFIIRSLVNKPLVKINTGLNGFFSYLNKESSDVQRIELSSKDEFEQMANVLNENIEKAKISIDEDKKILDEAIVVLGDLSKGDLSQRLNINSKNESLMQLKDVLNGMAENLELNVSQVLDILNEYSNNNYLNKINTNGLASHLLELANNVNNLGDTITSILIENKSNGLTLEDSSSILLQNVSLLNQSTNQSAVGLEETSSALEEITSITKNNTENAYKMAELSIKLKDTFELGQTLASDVSLAMDEIYSKVNAINESITVIDQIALQTNILSLNANVEAKSAGEFGKGFTVVAQEVRNLANRSADSAKIIKGLVSNANNTTKNGKSISDKMIRDFQTLSNLLKETIDIIENVKNSSSEQLIGIQQINGAVNELDKQTQQNANVSSVTHDIALQTEKISKLIVNNANAKEFRGKNEVKSKAVTKETL